MLQTRASDQLRHAPAAAPAGLHAPSRLEQLFRDELAQRRRLRAHETVFRAGQQRHALYFVHAGCVRTSIVTDDGREKITGFRLRGELLGLDAIDMPTYACDAVSLDVGEVLELPIARLQHASSALHECITATLAAEIRRDWRWMLATGSLSADQRVAEFLVDMGQRLETLGFSPRRMLLRMTRADIGNFLALTLETVTRALTRLQERGLIEVAGRNIGIVDRATLGLFSRGAAVH
ncbi:helix-turn-helix domain-containing protein [Chiayiivirga flava]|uniref:CRP-like protein Clp n=1 Tax=Chiayiivirga flava TaxID=659595 RepID=A0A7W8D4H2_9GAMM|nr:helix-turn-helix domain-containing protein [Chiayiivirga flava]MBB5206536.1 CRP/FNR family transcriptional regulator [Chiayiivirga flava]